MVSAEKKVSRTAAKIKSESSGSFLKCKEDFGVKIEAAFSPSNSDSSTESLHKKSNEGAGNAREYLEDELICEESLRKPVQKAKTLLELNEISPKIKGGES